MTPAGVEELSKAAGRDGGPAGRIVGGTERLAHRAPLTPADLARILGLPAPTDEQCAVIGAPLAPTLVVAGAGSGKTETMAARVVHLAANGIVRPDQILGLTFTRKAATELADRIRTRLRGLETAGIRVPDGDGRGDAGRPARIGSTSTDPGVVPFGTEPTVSTYHAFAGRIIAEFGALAGIGATGVVLGPTATWQLARQVVGRWDFDLDTDRTADSVTEDLLAVAGALADHLAGTGDLDRELGAVLDRLRSAPPSARQRTDPHSGLVDALRRLGERRALLPLVEAFDAAKRARGVVDFSDQMQLAARVVLASDQVGAALRERFPVVLLDEYQDTGHAQRVILRALFGAPHGRGHPVTAVGDPVQSIYGWRGASASNLPRFATDFPQPDGSPAERLSLLTSFRNAGRILELANAASESVRAAPVPVDRLRPRPGAPEGDVRTAVFERVDDEDRWLSARIAEIWSAATVPPTTAVLLRRRADMADVAAELRAVGLPVEVVGVGGLIDEPEVADLIATLRVVVDHDAGPAAVRLLLGPRWRLGLADLAALARRGREIARPAATGHRSTLPDDATEPGAPPDLPGSARAVPDLPGSARAVPDLPGSARAVPDLPGSARAVLTDAVASAAGASDGVSGLVDALLDPGPASSYSTEGFRRIGEFGAELRLLRARLGAPLPDLVADIQHLTGLEVEVLLRDRGRAHLDAFAAVVDELAATGAGPVELLDHLAAAADREAGLAPGAVEPAPGRVQVLTVHAAKGLEWDVVALPHLCEGVFPATRTTTWLGEAGRLPPGVRGDRDDLPELHLPRSGNQSDMVKALAGHVDDLKAAQLAEERRLMYVGLTRARGVVLLSAHHWGSTGQRPRGPSRFFQDITGLSAAGRRDVDEPAPVAGTPNPLTAEPRTAVWPTDPLGERRAAVEDGAAAVRRQIALLASNRPGAAIEPGACGAAIEPGGSGAATGPGGSTAATASAVPDLHGWQHDIDVLLAERAAGDPRDAAVSPPESLSVSALVDLATDPDRVSSRWRRPLPQPPAPQARRGTAFHAWVQRRYAGESLIDLDDLPGADDRDAAPDEKVPELIAAFRASPWSLRMPLAVEVPFSTVLGGMVVRGRIDAVFRDDDGGVTVVDWKTGPPPAGAAAEAAAVQLHAYRIAWSRLSGLPLDRVRAAFHYVAAGRTVVPPDLDGVAEFEARIRRALDHIAGGRGVGS